ncbi:outer membrane lipoprotein-sorting protein [Actinoalloteichus hoggarensis]|uniref:Uncharacterized protein n=1 Tax=Actinoalloteichus hoggarensis TaxID=1470176 RepID=A0A221VYA5_9PSEU|nr:hypothetical protein [Actinoalloteichus hoggarensis]ASO18495.1 hypothetical protein AHOG_04195 [Actinoalloteichus hoggarensis]MBB5921863.1 outer membrane lipoprotein-sorting protein [Actinoalloteichus hoggarensis]
MQKRKMTAGVAATGVLAGTAGLVWLAMPAGADPAPSLPEISPEALVESVLEAENPALAGTVSLENNLGLPSLGALGGSLGEAAVDFDMLSGLDAQIASDGEGRFRVISGYGDATSTIVYDGETLWEWDSATQGVVKSSVGGAEEADEVRPAGTDPAELARRAVEQLREISSVAVDGTASVVGRDAYELALAPGPDERTLLREVRVAVDSETRIPLRVTVLGNGSDEPVLEFGFTDVDFDAQDPEDFTFQPPAGASVQDLDDYTPHAGTPEPEAGTEPESGMRDAEPYGVESGASQVVGDGWDSVLVLSADELEGDAAQAADLDALPEGFGERVGGAWGEGLLIESAVVTAILTDDGRIAVGAVPAQVLTEALEEAR